MAFIALVHHLLWAEDFASDYFNQCSKLLLGMLFPFPRFDQEVFDPLARLQFTALGLGFQ